MVLGFLFTSKPLAPEVEPFDWRFLIHPQFMLAQGTASSDIQDHPRTPADDVL
jgi:hypothetical protein